MSREIAEGSTTASDSDVMAVLNDLAKILKRHLDNGEIVRFDDFGTFQVGISSDCAETEDKFHPSLIKSSKVIFRPSIEKKILLTLKYENAKQGI